MTDTNKVRFDALDLPAELQAGIKAAGFEYCTPIQAQTLPRALAGQDVAGQAQTGTGKTAAFLLATLNRLLLSPAGQQEAHKHPRHPDLRRRKNSGQRHSLQNSGGIWWRGL
jgi:ATP-dependent RNA helicase RhlB